MISPKYTTRVNLSGQPGSVSIDSVSGTKTQLTATSFLSGPRGFKGDPGDPAAQSVLSVNNKQGVVVINKSDVGLSNVDNTSDNNKPVSNATQTALDKKARKIEYNIEDYGAVGDAYTAFNNYTYNNSATDNTAAIQAAIDAATVTGGTVVVPGLAYMTDQLILKDNVSIRGVNRKTSTLVLKKNSTFGHIIKSDGFGTAGAATSTDDPYAGISYFTISNISFDGNAGNQTVSSGAGDYRDQFAIVKIYGWHYHFAEVEMRQAKENGLYTEHAANWYNTYNYYQFGESSYRQVFIKNYNGAGWVNRGSHDSMANGVYMSSYLSAGFNAYAGYVQQGNGNYNAQGMVAYNIHVWGTHQTNAVYISGSNIVEGFVYAEGSTQSAVFLNNSSANKFHVFAGFATHAVEFNGASNGNQITVMVESALTGSVARINTNASGNRIEQQGGYNSSGSALFDLSTGGTYTGTRNTFVPSRTFTGTLFNGTPSQLDNVGESGGSVFYVDDFGAAGDDTTDDAVKIQAANDKAPEGAIIQLSPRKYRINSPIYLTRGRTLRGTQGLRWRYAISPATYIKPRSTFTGLAAIIMQDKEQGGYATEQGGQRIENLNIDMSALTSGTADGIRGSGLVRDVRIEHVSVSYARGKGINTQGYLRLDGTTYYPRGWQLDHVTADTGFDNGFNFNLLTDSSLNDCLAVGNGAQGFSFSGSGENLITASRAVFNKNNGFLVTGSQYGTTSFVNISTDRNEYNGMLINVSGTTAAKYPINLTAPNFRRDGRNGNTGGGAYAGLQVTNAVSPVIVDNISVVQGVDDGGAGTSSPVYGVSATGSDLTITSGHIWGNTTAVNNGGTNTNLLVNQAVQLATGTVGGTKTTVRSGGPETSGYVLTANGVGNSPTWQAVQTSTPPDATTTSKGIVQLANDLGGTATAPTTPTAVHLSGTETITGAKTFTSQLKTIGASGGLYLNPNPDGGEFNLNSDANGTIAIFGTGANTLNMNLLDGYLQLSTLNATTVPYLDANKRFGSSTVTPTELGYVSGVTSNIQTQLNAKATDSAVVHTTGAETVAGVKTFSSSPIVPTPSGTTDVTNKSYVDTADALNLPLSGGTMTGTLITATPSGTLAALRIPSGIVLSTPVSGTIENDGAALYYTNSSNARLSLATRTGIETISNKTLQTPIFNGYKTAYAAKTAAYTTVNTDVTINGNATSAAFTVTLLTAAGNTGLVQYIRKSDSSANAITVATTSSQTINGSSTYLLSSQYKYVCVQSDGANWMVIGNN